MHLARPSKRSHGYCIESSFGMGLRRNLVQLPISIRYHCGKHDLWKKNNYIEIISCNLSVLLNRYSVSSRDQKNEY